MLDKIDMETGKVVDTNIRIQVESRNVKKISSTTARMYHHMDRLQEIQKGILRPITIHLSLTDICNLDCWWCSTKDRAENTWTLEDAKAVIKKYKTLGIKSLELTGGGDPTCYKELAEVIMYAKELGLGVGMITNGLLLNRVPERALKELSWLRISLSGIEVDLGDKYFNIKTDRLPDFVGCSFVFPDERNEKFLPEVQKISNHFNSKYTRIVSNCYSPEDIEWGRKNIPEAIKAYESFFFQSKDYYTPEKCYWKYLKPFVNSDGYVYQCSTCSLFKGYFPEEWRVCYWTEVEKIYEKPIVSYDTNKCPYCFFYNQNNVVNDLMIDVGHKKFF
jgi:organic radical activating enzyme